jgi:hypothetical protein
VRFAEADAPGHGDQPVGAVQLLDHREHVRRVARQRAERPLQRFDQPPVGPAAQRPLEQAPDLFAVDRLGADHRVGHRGQGRAVSGGGDDAVPDLPRRDGEVLGSRYEVGVVEQHQGDVRAEAGQQPPDLRVDGGPSGDGAVGVRRAPTAQGSGAPHEVGAGTQTLELRVDRIEEEPGAVLVPVGAPPAEVDVQHHPSGRPGGRGRVPEQGGASAPAVPGEDDEGTAGAVGPERREFVVASHGTGRCLRRRRSASRPDAVHAAFHGDRSVPGRSPPTSMVHRARDGSGRRRSGRSGQRRCPRGPIRATTSS